MKTKKAYKLFRTLKSRPGEIFPLFIGKTQSIPLNTWIPAEDIKTKGFAHRPGWHVAAKPETAHLSEKGRVWAEVEIPANVDYQPKANKTKTKDLKYIPENGYYRFKRPVNQGGEWWIAGAIKVNRVLQ